MFRDELHFRPPLAENQIKMGAQHRIRIEWRVSAENALPDHGQDRGRYYDLRERVSSPFARISPRATPSSINRRRPAKPRETTSR